MRQVQMGIKGIVMSKLTGKPISNATLSIMYRKKVINTTANGEFWKILLPGIYKLHVSIIANFIKSFPLLFPNRFFHKFI